MYLFILSVLLITTQIFAQDEIAKEELQGTYEDSHKKNQPQPHKKPKQKIFHKKKNLIKKNPVIHQGKKPPLVIPYQEGAKQTHDQKKGP